MKIHLDMRISFGSLEFFRFPEIVLSYLVYTQAFDAFNDILENVSNTQYTPSHLVAFHYSEDIMTLEVNLRN